MTRKSRKTAVWTCTYCGNIYDIDDINYNITPKIEWDAEIFHCECGYRLKPHYICHEIEEKMADKNENIVIPTMFKKYVVNLRPHISWLIEQIDKSKDGCIIIPIKELSEKIGITNVSKRRFLVGLKYAFFHEKIWLMKVRINDVLILRRVIESDVLPDYLSTNLHTR